MATLAPEEMLRVPGMTFLQHHRTRHLQLKVRFGRWEEILNSPAPDEDLPHARAMWHYARGRALAARGDVRAAKAEAVYREDLDRFPENGWSLFGLAQALREQGKEAEAAEVARRWNAAWGHADVKLTASQF